MLKWIKRLADAYMIVDFVGRYIENLLHESDSGQIPLTPKQKELLKRLLDAVSLLKGITSSWQQAFKPLEVNNIHRNYVDVKVGLITIDLLASPKCKVVYWT